MQWYDGKRYDHHNYDYACYNGSLCVCFFILFTFFFNYFVVNVTVMNYV